MVWQIAIDGPAGAGKSTIAKMLADRLKFVYLDTGAMYRAVSLVLNQENIALDDIVSIKNILANMQLSFSDGGKTIFCNGVDVSEDIRMPEVANKVSIVAKIACVREAMVLMQQKIANSIDVVVDGRDIGTVVLPNAQVKIFLTASLEERTKRRFDELQSKGVKVDFDELYAEIALRDENDIKREISPLKMADDAVLVDTTGLFIDDVIKNVLSIIENRGFHLG